MANYGKFTDRNPTIVAAGVTTPPAEFCGLWMDEHHPEEMLQYHHMLKCKSRFDKVPRLKADRFHCDDPSILPVTAGVEKGRFVQFQDEFLESLYSKKAPLGKPLSVKSIPEHVTNDSMTFGQQTEHDEPVYDIIFPRKSEQQVNSEYAAWHKKYIISHNHYFPSEQINRHYNENFDPTQTFGEFTGADRNGGKTKLALKQCPQHQSITNTHFDFLVRTRAKLGENRFKYKYTVPLDMRHGIVTKPDACNAHSLLEAMENCEVENPLEKAISYIHKLRHKLQNLAWFNMRDILNALRFTDVDKKGVLPLSTITTTLLKMHILLDDRRMRLVLKYYGLVPEDDNCPDPLIDWQRFWQMINSKWTLPKGKLLGNIPKNNWQNDTTYRQFCRSLLEGHTYNRFNAIVECLMQQRDTTRAETAGDSISPGIPTQYFLDETDFSKPREKQILRTVFKRVVSEDEAFNALWQRAKDKFHPEEGDDVMLSVEELRQVL